MNPDMPAQSIAERTAARALAKAVTAQIRTRAAASFADAGDAVDVLMRDASKYVDSDGEIDTDLIEADLADLLDRKPHWAKPEPAPVANEGADDAGDPEDDENQDDAGEAPQAQHNAEYFVRRPANQHVSDYHFNRSEGSRWVADYITAHTPRQDSPEVSTQAGYYTRKEVSDEEFAEAVARATGRPYTAPTYHVVSKTPL